MRKWRSERIFTSNWPFLLLATMLPSDVSAWIASRTVVFFSSVVPSEMVAVPAEELWRAFLGVSDGPGHPHDRALLGGLLRARQAVLEAVAALRHGPMRA